MKSYRLQIGFTLIEILIVVTISAIMMLGVAKIFDITKRGYIANESDSRMQESARLAMYFISRNFRQAGLMGCRNGLSVRAGSALGVENLLSSTTSHANNFVTGSGASTILHAVVSQRVPSTVPGWMPPNAVPGTDLITIRGAFSSGRLTTTNTAGATIPLDNADDFFAVDDHVLITDCKALSIANVDAEIGTQLTANSNLMVTYPTNSEVFRLETIDYFIQISDTNVPSLFQRTDGDNASITELVEGVENLRLLFGEDTNSDARPDRFVPAGTSGLIMDNVVALRVSLLIRSLRNDVDLGAQTIVHPLPGGDVTTTDALRRDIYTITISFRNSVIGI